MTWRPVYVDDGGRPGYAATREGTARVVVLYDYPQGERAKVRLVSRRTGLTLADTELDRDAVEALRAKLDRVLERMTEAESLRGITACPRCGVQVFRAAHGRKRVTCDAEPVPEGENASGTFQVKYHAPGHPEAVVRVYRPDLPTPPGGRYRRHECKGAQE